MIREYQGINMTEREEKNRRTGDIILPWHRLLGVSWNGAMEREAQKAFTASLFRWIVGGACESAHGRYRLRAEELTGPNSLDQWEVVGRDFSPVPD